MKTRHNFNKDLRMDLACSDYFRPVFSYIHFKDGYAYASDIHILVKNKLSECSTFTDEEIEKLDGKFIGSKAYKSILSYDMVQVTDMGFECMLYDNQKVIYPFSGECNFRASKREHRGNYKVTDRSFVPLQDWKSSIQF